MLSFRWRRPLGQVPLAAALALLLTAVPAPAQTLPQIAQAHGAQGFGFVWSGDRGIWFDPDGTAIRVDRGRSGLYARYFDRWSVQADGRICLTQTIMIKAAFSPKTSCFSLDGARCHLRGVTGAKYRMTRRCSFTLQELPAWRGFDYDEALARWQRRAS